PARPDARGGGADEPAAGDQGRRGDGGRAGRRRGGSQPLPGRRDRERQRPARREHRGLRAADRRGQARRRPAAAGLQPAGRRLSNDRTKAEVRTEMSRKDETTDRERYLLLKGMLEDRRREIHEKLRSLREAIPAATTHDVRDAEEQSVDEFVQEVDLALMQMKTDTLRKIDQAI